MGGTSSSGCPLSSVYFFRIHDFTCAPRLVKVILYSPFSITVSDSEAACFVAICAGCAALLDTEAEAVVGFALGAGVALVFGAVAAGFVSGAEGCGLLK